MTERIKDVCVSQVYIHSLVLVVSMATANSQGFYILAGDLYNLGLIIKRVPDKEQVV